MPLHGTVTAGRPLLVVATKEEAVHLPAGHPVLLTGIGKINAAVALTATLSTSPRPSEIVNLGTAGALRPGWEGVHLVRRVIQHDLDTDLLRDLTGETYGADLDLASEDGPILATGDVFVADESARERLAARADLVDMEGYAIAQVAASFGIPVRLVKCVSDSAGDDATRTWQDNVVACSLLLSNWLRDTL